MWSASPARRSATFAKVVWRRALGYTTAASPAIGDGVVYMPLMSKIGHDPGPSTGAVLALDANTGRLLWRFAAGAVESSPLLLDGVLYFGSFDRLLHAVDTKTKKELWTFRTGDAIKGTLVGSDGRGNSWRYEFEGKKK